MIVTELYKGQGFGNQLWCYVVTRTIAADNGYEFGIMAPENFKGADLMRLDFGKEIKGGKGPEGGPPERLPEGISYYYQEKKLIHPITGADIREHDDELVRVRDNTKIDGVMQDERYIAHRKEEIRQWLMTEGNPPLELSGDDLCIINFRGGEYTSSPDTFLSQKYWRDAIGHMKQAVPAVRFAVVTDDVASAKRFFPDFAVFHFGIRGDYLAINHARYLIVSNSSFAWFPAWLNPRLELCIAPKYWARHNVSDGYWSCGYNITSGWLYLDRNGRLSAADECRQELEAYRNSRLKMLSSRPGKIYSLFARKINLIKRGLLKTARLCSSIYSEKLGQKK